MSEEVARVRVNQHTPVVSPQYVYNQVFDPSAATWSMMTDIGGDLRCSSDLNDALNRLSPFGVIHYTMNYGNSYTTTKVNPYTAIQINNMTQQERTLKSSVCVSITFLPLSFITYLKRLNVTLTLGCCVD